MGSPVRVGIAGCGRMGVPMARALLRAQIDTTGFDIRTNDTFDGVPMQFDPGRFAAPLTQLFTVVRDQAETDALLFEEQALLKYAPALETLVICSTLPPDYIPKLRERIPGHIALVDAPMSGARVAAEQGRLTFIIGGAHEDVDAIQLFLSAMGTQFHHMGPLGSGMTAKVLNNLVAAASAAATRTALNWGRFNGIEPRHLLQVMQESSGQTWFGSGWDEIEFTRYGFAADNTMGILAKDVECAKAAAPDGASMALPDALIEVIRNLEPFED